MRNLRSIICILAMLSVAGCAHPKPASQKAALRSPSTARRVESAPGNHPHTIKETFEASATTQ